MPRWLNHLLFVLVLVVFGGCAGSCGGCSGCGVTPLPGGFAADKRVENASSVRLTDSGVQFLSQNLGTLAGQLVGSGTGSNGVVTFDVPTSTQNFTIASVTICKDGPKPNATPMECIAEVGLGQAKLTITTAAPHDIKVTGTLPVRLQKITTTLAGVYVVLDDNGKFAPIPVDADISLETDLDPTHASRKGYTKVKINTLSVDKNAIQTYLHFEGSGIGGAIVSAIANALKGFIAGQLITPMTDSLKSTVEQQLCTKEDPATGVTCPSGTYPDSGGTCRYCSPNAQGKCPDTSADCVGTAIGTEGNLDLESALASLSPGTKGGFDFLAAAGGEGKRDNDPSMTWGDLDPVAGGATLGMLGGAEPTPLAKCAPIATLTRPSGIPIPDELRANTVSGWTGPGPHIGLALSERYLNYLLGSVYNSGALCLGIGSSTLGSMLNSDTLGLLMPSLKDLGRQRHKQPLALMVRPQNPPTVKIGNGTDLAKDPLLQVTMKDLLIDFYIWSSDRYVRAFSASFDVVVPVNLDVNDKSQLTPVVDKIDVQNPKLTNDPLLREDEAKSASALASIIAGQVGKSLGGAISPIDLSGQLAAYGIQLQIPPTVAGQGSPGLRLLTKGSDNFLGIFAAFAMAPGSTAPPLRSHTTVELVEKTVDPAGLVLPTITPEDRPKVEIRVGSSLDTGVQPIEYQYRLDRGFWHEWTRSRDIVIDAPSLSLQARHTVDVRSRVVGEPLTVDSGYATLGVVIDKSPPDIELADHVSGDALRIDVHDVVSPASAVSVRWALDGAGYGAWKRASQLSSIDVGRASRIRVEAKDEEGNVATKQQGLIRGRQDPALAAASACGCRVPGGDRSSDSGLGLLLGLGLLVWLRRRDHGQD